VTNTSVSDGIIDFTGISALTLNAGENKHLAVMVNTLAGGDVAGDTYRMTIAAISDIKYSVTEAELGYDGDKDGNISGSVDAIPGSSTAYAYTVTKK